MKKVCPIMTGSVVKNFGEIKHITCIKEDCQLWLLMYTTENISTSMCAFEAMATKNNNGKIPV